MLQFCDADTHIHVPEIREISDVLLDNGVKVLHAGRTRAFVREAPGLAILSWALLKKLITQRLSGKGSGISLDSKITYLGSESYPERS